MKQKKLLRDYLAIVAGPFIVDLSSCLLFRAWTVRGQVSPAIASSYLCAIHILSLGLLLMQFAVKGRSNLLGFLSAAVLSSMLFGLFLSTPWEATGLLEGCAAFAWCGISLAVFNQLICVPRLVDCGVDRIIMGSTEESFIFASGATWHSHSPEWIRSKYRTSLWIGLALILIICPIIIALIWWWFSRPGIPGLAKFSDLSPAVMILGTLCLVASYVIGASILSRTGLLSPLVFSKSAEIASEISHLRGYVLAYCGICFVVLVLLGASISYFGLRDGDIFDSVFLALATTDDFVRESNSLQKLFFCVNFVVLSAVGSFVSAVAVSMLVERQVQRRRSSLAQDEANAAIMLADSKADLEAIRAARGISQQPGGVPDPVLAHWKNFRSKPLFSRLEYEVSYAAADDGSLNLADLAFHRHAWWIWCTCPEAGLNRARSEAEEYLRRVIRQCGLDYGNLCLRWSTPAEMQWPESLGPVIPGFLVDELAARIERYLALVWLHAPGEIEDEARSIARLIYSEVDWAPDLPRDRAALEGRVLCAIAGAAAYSESYSGERVKDPNFGERKYRWLSGLGETAILARTHWEAAQLIMNGRWSAVREFSARSWFVLLMFDPVARRVLDNRFQENFWLPGDRLVFEPEESWARSVPRDMSQVRWAQFGTQGKHLVSSDVKISRELSIVAMTEGHGAAGGWLLRELAFANLVGRSEFYRDIRLFEIADAPFIWPNLMLLSISNALMSPRYWGKIA